MASNKQLLKDHKAKEVGVFLPIEEYNALIDRIDELADINAYLSAEIEDKGESIPFDKALKMFITIDHRKDVYKKK